MSDAGVRMYVGKPGAGKSYTSVKLIVMALLRGEYVVTNVPLHDGWEHQVARMRFGWLHGRKWRERRAARLRWQLHRVRTLGEMTSVGVPGCGRCPACRRGKACAVEGRALAVADETPKELNARLWNTDADRQLLVDWVRMHRHLGYAVALITQAEGLLDAQIRGIGETYVLLRNLRRIPHWANVFWYLRIDFFCATTYWGVPGRTGTLRARTEWSFLSRRIAGLYDTMGGFVDGDASPTVWPWGGGPEPGEGAESPEPCEGGDARDTASGDATQGRVAV